MYNIVPVLFYPPIDTPLIHLVTLIYLIDQALWAENQLLRNSMNHSPMKKMNSREFLDYTTLLGKCDELQLMNTNLQTLVKNQNEEYEQFEVTFTTYLCQISMPIIYYSS